MSRRPRAQAAGSGRRLLVDLTPLRASRDVRALVAGQAGSVLGSQMTAVAVPYEVYRLTGSSFAVGLVSLSVLGPLLLGSLVGGAVVDVVDRRRLLVVLQTTMAVLAAGLALNEASGPSLWPLFVGPALIGGLSTFEDSGLGAVIPSLVRPSQVPAVNAVFQALFQFGLVAGPAIAGLLVAGAGTRWVFGIDAASFALAAVATLGIAAPAPVGGGPPPGLGSIAAGFRFLRGRQSLQGALLIDLNATVLGLPRALFPALAATVFGGGPATLGLLYAAPGVGALGGALASGWVTRVERQGRAVIIAVVVWGLAITGFGCGPPLGVALVLLAVAGWADVVSAVFRSSIIQLGVPDELRGRLTGLQTAVVTGGPRLGDLEAGAVAAGLGDLGSVVSGGIGCVLGAVLLARLRPGFRAQTRPVPSDDPTPQATAPL